MKNLLLVFLLFPFFVNAQTVILKLNQPPELSFDANNQDTTILKGKTVVLGTDLIVSGGSEDYLFIWSPGKSLNDSTIMNPTANPEDTTNYFLTVTDGYGCSFTLNYKVNVKIIPTNTSLTDDQNTVLTVKLFPNPNDGKFKVQLKGMQQDNIRMIVLDDLGRIIKEKVIRYFPGEIMEEVDLKLPAGSYSMLIHSEFAEIHRQFIIK